MPKNILNSPAEISLISFVEDIGYLFLAESIISGSAGIIRNGINIPFKT